MRADLTGKIEVGAILNCIVPCFISEPMFPPENAQNLKQYNQYIATYFVTARKRIPDLKLGL